MDSFLARLSSSNPIPGGGGAAAYAASVGLALLEKISRVELGRLVSSPEKKMLWDTLLADILQLRKSFDELREEDGQAYIKMVQARAVRTQHREAFKEALLAAVECPATIMKKANKALACVGNAAEGCRRHLLPDLLVVAEIFSAASRGSYHIAQANLKIPGGDAVGSHYPEQLEHLKTETKRLFFEAERLIIRRQKSLA